MRIWKKSFFDHDLLFPTLKIEDIFTEVIERLRDTWWIFWVFSFVKREVHPCFHKRCWCRWERQVWVGWQAWIYLGRLSRRVLPYFRIRRLVLYSPFFVSDFQHHVGPFCSHKKLRITTLFTAVKCRLSLEGKK